MSHCQCQGIENTFDRRLAESQLQREHRRGPQRTTLMLVEALRAQGVAGRTLLDIGGGVGAVQRMLLESGITKVTGVDAASSSWWTRLGVRLLNLSQRIRGSTFRIFAHPTEDVESLLRDQGLSRIYRRTRGIWQVAVFTRAAGAA